MRDGGAGCTVTSVESSFWRVVRNPWLTTAVRLFLLEFVVVLGTDATVREKHLEPPLDPVGYGLLAVMAAATVLRRWPLAAFGVALGATLAFLLLGHPGQGPYMLGVMVALYYTVSADRPWRSVALGALTVASTLAAGAVVSGYQSVPESVISALAAVVVPLGIGHVVASRRAWTRRTREEETQHRVIEERLRIARELHDVVSHSISMINVQAGVAAHVMDERPDQAREALLAIKGSSKEVLRELRAILGILRDVDEVESKAPAPGLAQLDVLVEAITRAGLPTTVSLAGGARPLPPGIDLIAYRIVQESLTNVLRHAGPATVEVKVSYEGGRVVIEVADDGQGIEAPTNGHRTGPGHGIAGMRERAAAVGGELEAGPRPVRGFRVRACLPYA
jgi:signal transduction histidine kinase